MSRSWLSIDSREDLLDAVADLSHDAYEGEDGDGLSTDEIVVTLQRVEDEIINREELDRRKEELETDGGDR